MSFAKRMLAAQEEERTATRIAIQVGALEACEFHGDTFDGTGDLEAACRLGNSKFSDGEFEGVFESRRDMTDTIKSVIEDQPEECPVWERMLAD